MFMGHELYTKSTLEGPKAYFDSNVYKIDVAV